MPGGFTRQDQLRGSIAPERAWWDVQHYTLALSVMPETRSLRGSNTIVFKTLAAGSRMQIDLQPPLAITEVKHADRALEFDREGNVYWVRFPTELPAGAEHTVVVHYEGKPRVSTRPPWSGGLSCRRTSTASTSSRRPARASAPPSGGRTRTTAPTSPDRGMDLHLTVPAALTAVANGRLIATTTDEAQRTRTFHWRVKSPINNYGVNVNIGNYVSIDGTYEGEGGTLDLQYWVLAHQVEQAKRQFEEVPRTLAAFEHWFGKYPFYEDGYKLVVVPYLGMEHQSSVTYGNGFRNGYLGRDLSRTGVGLKFDFIIVHESAHEWWGNNISMRDAADMWIHESFANYAENLFVEYHFSAEEAQDYVIGCRALIQNDEPIIGTYGVNKSGSGDMYYKGGNMLHTMRHMLDDDRRCALDAARPQSRVLAPHRRHRRGRGLHQPRLWPRLRQGVRSVPARHQGAGGVLARRRRAGRGLVGRRRRRLPAPVVLRLDGGAAADRTRPAADRGAECRRRDRGRARPQLLDEVSEGRRKVKSGYDLRSTLGDAVARFATDSYLV